MNSTGIYNIHAPTQCMIVRLEKHKFACDVSVAFSITDWSEGTQNISLSSVSVKCESCWVDWNFERVKNVFDKYVSSV